MVCVRKGKTAGILQATDVCPSAALLEMSPRCCGRSQELLNARLESVRHVLQPRRNLPTFHCPSHRCD